MSSTEEKSAQNPLDWTEEDDRLLQEYVAMGKAVQDGTYYNRKNEFTFSLPPAPEPEKPKGLLGTVKHYADDVADGTIHGYGKALENTADFALDAIVGISNAGVKATNWVLDKLDFDDYYRLDPVVNPWEDGVKLGADSFEPETTVGNLASGVAQFGTGFAITGAAGKALGAGKAAGSLLGATKGPLAKALGTMAHDMATDAVAFAPDDRLADMLVEQVPTLAGIIPDFLTSDPDDTKMEGRVKNALEGVFVGGAMEAVLSGVRALKRLRNAEVKLDPDTAKALTKDIESATKAANEVLQPPVKADVQPKAATGGVKAATETLTASQQHDVNLEAFVREFTRLKNNGVPLSDFKVLQSIRNNIRNSDDVRRVFDALEADGVFQRSTDSTRRVSFEETVGRAHEILDKANATGVDRDTFIREMGGELGDQLADAPAKIVLLNDLTLDATQQLGASLKTGSMEAIDEALDKTIGIIFEYDRVQTGAGRTLQIFDPISDKTNLFFKAINYNRHAVEMLGPEESARVIRENLLAMTPQQKSVLAARLSTVKDIPSLAQALRVESRTGKFMIMQNEVWINLILSGMRTQSANVLSNLWMTAVQQPLSKMAGAPLSALRNGGWSAEETRAFQEGWRTWGAIYETAVDSFRMACESFKLGENILKPGASVIEENTRAIRAEAFGYDTTSTIGHAIDILGDVVRLPSRFLMAGDEFGSQLTYRAGELARARIQGEELYRLEQLKGKGTKEEIVEKFAQDAYNRSLATKELPDGRKLKGAVGVMDRGLAEAQDATFTTPFRRGSLGDDIQKLANGHPVVRRFFAPFVRTPINVAKSAIVDNSPLALAVSRAYKDAIARGGTDAAAARGRVALGTLTYFVAWNMALNGTITDGGPRNSKQRDMLLAKGWKPYSIRVGDRYISYKNVEPIGTILGLAADAAAVYAAADPDSEQGVKIAQVFSSLPFTIYHAVSSKTFMRTMAETFSMLNDSSQAANWASSQLQSYNPAFLRQLKTVLDPNLREAQGFIEKLKAQTPGLSETLPLKYSWLTGEPLSIYGGRAAGLSPVVSEYSPDDTVASELLKYSELWMEQGGIKWEDSYTVGRTKMNGQQRSDFDRLQGTLKLDGLTLHQALQKVIDSPEYGKDEPIDRDPRGDEKFLMLDKVVQRYRKAAKLEFFRNEDNAELSKAAKAAKSNTRDKKLAKQVERENAAKQSDRTAKMLDKLREL